MGGFNSNFFVAWNRETRSFQITRRPGEIELVEFDYRVENKIMNTIKPKLAVACHFLNEEATRFNLFQVIREAYDRSLYPEQHQPVTYK